MFVDAHLHADTRSYEDFARMRLAGIDMAITCAHDFVRMSVSQVYFDHFDRLLNKEVRRAKENGIRLFVALGVHPEGIPGDYEVVLDSLPKYLRENDVVAVGEIGLETASKKEIHVFERQLEIAKDFSLPVIVHTPRVKKREITEKIVDILNRVGYPKERALVDHTSYENLQVLLENDIPSGLSIQPPTKLTAKDAAKIILEYEGKFILNSDCSSKSSDIYAVPRCFVEMESIGVDEQRRWEVSRYNAIELFNLP